MTAEKEQTPGGGSMKEGVTAGEEGGGDGGVGGGFLVWVRNLPLCQPQLDIK